jgi:hypothetical protein
VTATAVPATLIRIVRIDFNRAEGYTHECGLRSFFSWEDFNHRIRRAALTAPADGSWHKCDVRVTWADGSTWSYRIDLTADHAVQERPASSEAYCSLVFFRGDLATPDGEDPTHYLAEFDENYPGMRARATWLLVGYDLGRP